jgi:PAB1-binding protein PBP1
LQRWQPDAGDEHADFSLEEDSGAGWDQFAVNKAKFGVVTTFREELYTTALDKGNCGISEAEAARIAREIELGVSAAPGMARLHILEERGMEVDDQVGTGAG